MNEADLRAGLATVRDVPDNTWELLKELGFVEEAVGGFGQAEDDPVGYLVEKFDRISDGAPIRGGLSRPKGRTSGGESIPPQLTEYEIGRSELFSEYLAKLTASDVEDFRGKHLDGKLLSPKQARALLTSPVAAHWPHLEFDLQGIPIVGHSYQVEENKHDEKGPYSLVRVSVPASRNPWFKDRRQPKTGAWEWPDKRRDVKTNETPRREFKTGYPPQEKTWKILPFPGADGYTHRTVVKPFSVLGVLCDKVTRLIQRYPWEEADATWFVLTGETPWVAPLTWQFRGIGAGFDSWNYGYITLKVEPWVSASVVERVYSNVQHQLLGKDNKRVGEKNRELFRFVIVRMKPDGSLPRARELVKEWDHEYPQWRYGHDDIQQVRRFRRDYNLVRRLLAAPSYDLSEE